MHSRAQGLFFAYLGVVDAWIKTFDGALRLRYDAHGVLRVLPVSRSAAGANRGRGSSSPLALWPFSVSSLPAGPVSATLTPPPSDGGRRRSAVRGRGGRRPHHGHRRLIVHRRRIRQLCRHLCGDRRTDPPRHEPEQVHGARTPHQALWSDSGLLACVDRQWPHLVRKRRACTPAHTKRQTADGPTN
jgi:hypothetical protein